jgi:dihydroorotate dehydrogenase
MDLARACFDGFYDSIKRLIFSATKNDPEKAHELFAWSCRVLYNTGLGSFLLDNKHNRGNPGFTLANAAGFNKNADIPPKILRLLGFDRCIIGTVTAEKWQGNDKAKGYYGKQRIIRFPKTESMVNWLELPNISAERIVDKLWTYEGDTTPITVNLMATPDKKGDAALRDLESTVGSLRNIPFIDRFELNISCPNISENGIVYQERTKEMIGTIQQVKHPWQDLDVKVSPDLTEGDIDSILNAVDGLGIRAFTTTNSTTSYDSRCITEQIDKGGASGNAVYAASLKVQKLFYEKTGGCVKLNACGGINSAARARERLEQGASEIQILTPFIFCGPRLLRDIRKYFIFS